MKLYIMFHLNYLLLQYKTKDNIEVENSKVTNKSWLDLFHTALARPENKVSGGTTILSNCMMA